MLNVLMYLQYIFSPWIISQSTRWCHFMHILVDIPPPRGVSLIKICSESTFIYHNIPCAIGNITNINSAYLMYMPAKYPSTLMMIININYANCEHMPTENHPMLLI